jgi:DNA transformation protein
MFSIAGALQNVHWNELDPAYKRQLLEQLEGRTGSDTGED